MQETNKICEALIKDFTENYMKKLFYFCLKKTGNNEEAEDLTQDIALQIITSLNKGTIPSNFSAWVWQIARNRYSVWSEAKHKRNDMLTGDYIDDCEVEDENRSILDEMIHTEQMALLRRELAFIKSDYRNIVVAYYIENNSVRDIAASLSISISAVQQRLHRARKILKEGMDMAREFGKRSYNPENVIFINNCTSFGEKGQPWSILSHALYKNIFLEAYDNPSTAQELSFALGVALPYMEDELEFLTRETFLIKSEGRYETNFPIVSKEVREKTFEYQMKISARVTHLLESLIDEYNIICENHDIRYYGGNQTYEDAKWTLLMLTVDNLIDEVDNHKHTERTERPDGGKWDIVGFQLADIPELPWVGQHGCLDSDEVKVYFQQYKFYRDGIDLLTPDYLNENESVALWQIANNNTADCNRNTIDKLINYGYIKKSESGYEPNIVVFEKKQESKITKQFTDEELERVGTIAAQIKSIFRDALDYVNNLNMNDMSASLLKNPKIKEFAATYSQFDRSIVLEQAIKDGWIKFDENSNRAIGAYIFI